jgi:RsiW-degrading membrane proteinase PrsW (M82 family)
VDLPVNWFLLPIAFLVVYSHLGNRKFVLPTREANMGTFELVVSLLSLILADLAAVIAIYEFVEERKRKRRYKRPQPKGFLKAQRRKYLSPVGINRATR